MAAQNILSKYDFHKTLIIDIETVPQTEHFDKLAPALQKHWEHKAKFLKLSAEEEEQPALSFAQRGGIYAEFGKIVCIGLGFINQKGEALSIRLKSLQADDEKALLHSFCEIITALEKQYKEVIFCGHNIKEFDLPYICRRMLINSMSLPYCLQMSGMKPWQIPHKDTMELWRFGDYKHYTSLDLLAAILGVESSKTSMDGSMVADAYWQKGMLTEIAEYCLRDIHTTAMVYLKLLGLDKELLVEYV